VASQKSKHRSRKRRTAGARPRPVIPPRERGVERPAEQGEQTALGIMLTGKVYGDPPPNRFGGVPVSEIAILCGAIALVVGLTSSSAPALIVGVVVCALGVIEWTSREHFSGYRSHATLLAGIPAVVLGVLMIALFSGSLGRVALLVVVVPVFAVLFWVLRQRFRTARQARVVKPPAP
jgi:hypothetical protein